MVSLATFSRSLERSARKGDSSQMRTFANEIAAEYDRMKPEIADLSLA
jgi:hypothetical protein